MKAAFEIALEEINAAGGILGKTVELRYSDMTSKADTESSEDKAVVEALIRCGAFDSLHDKSRRAAMLAALRAGVEDVFETPLDGRALASRVCDPPRRPPACANAPVRPRSARARADRRERSGSTMIVSQLGK